NFKRRYVPAKGPLINRAAGFRVAHGKELVVHAHVNALRVDIKVTADQAGVTERRSHEQIGLAPTPDQAPNDFLTITNHPLRGGGFVVHVASVNVRAVLEKEFRNLNGAGEMERCLAVAT